MSRQKNILERTVFGISILLILAMLGYLTYEVIRVSSGSPAIRVSLGVARPQAGRLVVPVRVTNEGGEAAEDVRVEVVLRMEGAVLERAGVTFARLPRSATREGWVVFSSERARAGEMQAYILSYTTP